MLKYTNQSAFNGSEVSDMKKYLAVYTYFRDKILNGQLKYRDQLPSIREASKLFSVSKTTIENAYFELQAEGYILSSPKSGFFVSYRKKTKESVKKEETGEKRKIRYDLKSGDADRESFDIRLWHRYINSALRQEDRLCSYSEPQGEEDLRDAISEYIRKKRNIITSPDRIVVGAGIKTLMHIICGIIDERGTVSFPDSSFRQGISTFETYGFTVHTRDKDADIIYVSPSHMTMFGDVMPVKRRMELIGYSEKKGSLVIEDDIDNDFLYSNRKPTPSLFALSSADNIIYMSSFANVLTPGIRISFMVLPESLSEIFRERKENFAQTASKTEQIALCGYIRDGHLGAQTRKIRRHYTQKTQEFLELLKEKIPDAEYILSENGLQIRMIKDFSKDRSAFRKESVDVYIENIENGKIKLIISPSAIEASDMEGAFDALKRAIN